jgi:hypothetical protein
VPFIGREREGRQCHGGETSGGEWSSSMLPFRREERKEKGAHGLALGSHTEG